MVAGGPSEKPAFTDPARAESIGYVQAPPDAVPTFDQELSCEYDPEYAENNPPEGKGPSRGYRERWRAIARYHALGKSNNFICGKLGYSPTAVSLALKSDWVQAEVERYRTSYETDIIHRVKEAAIDGVEVIHQIILNEKEKSATRLDAAKWAAEKTTGKARQEVSVESGTLTNFMELLRDMKNRGEQLRDVGPGEAGPLLSGEVTDAEQPSKYDTWLDENLAR